MKRAASKYRYHKKVFVFPPWREIYITDSERKQDWDEIVLTDDTLRQTYSQYDYE